MAIKLPKIDIKTLTLLVSLILNLLGGTGTISPLLGGAPDPAAPSPSHAPQGSSPASGTPAPPSSR